MAAGAAALMLTTACGETAPAPTPELEYGFSCEMKLIAHSDLQGSKVKLTYYENGEERYGGPNLVTRMDPATAASRFRQCAEGLEELYEGWEYNGDFEPLTRPDPWRS